MARPQKNDADWFKHDKDMRNDPKILALRRRFGLEGYAIWCMTLEMLTDADGFQIPVGNLDLELTAGDVCVDKSRLLEVWSYCQELTLLQREGMEGDDGGVLYSKRLKERMEPVIGARMQDRVYSRTRKRDPDGIFGSYRGGNATEESRVDIEGGAAPLNGAARQYSASHEVSDSRVATPEEFYAFKSTLPCYTKAKPVPPPVAIAKSFQEEFPEAPHD